MLTYRRPVRQVHTVNDRHPDKTQVLFRFSHRRRDPLMYLDMYGFPVRLRTSSPPNSSKTRVSDKSDLVWSGPGLPSGTWPWTWSLGGMERKMTNEERVSCTFYSGHASKWNQICWVPEKKFSEQWVENAHKEDRYLSYWRLLLLYNNDTKTLNW